jgi:hypothetical protein
MVLALSIVVLGLFIPIVPRLVVPLIWPYPYDDPFFGSGIARVGLQLAWNALPFVLLALIAYIALTRPAATERKQTRCWVEYLVRLSPASCWGYGYTHLVRISLGLTSVSPSSRCICWR